MGERDMHTEAQVKPAHVVRLREQISNLHSLFVLSMMMTESRDEDEILSLAVTSVASLGPCTTDGAYRPAAEPGGEPERFREPAGRKRKALAAALVALGGDDGPADVPGAGRGVAHPPRRPRGHRGWVGGR